MNEQLLLSHLPPDSVIWPLPEDGKKRAHPIGEAVQKDGLSRLRSWSGRAVVLLSAWASLTAWAALTLLAVLVVNASVEARSTATSLTTGGGNLWRFTVPPGQPSAVSSTTPLAINSPEKASKKRGNPSTKIIAAKPSLIGLAKAVVGTVRVSGDSVIRVNYRFVLTNFGDDTLRRIQVTDDLAYAFGQSTVVSAVVTLPATGSTLVRNPLFSGRGNNGLLFGQTNLLAPGRSQSFTLSVTIRRAVGDTTSVFRNSASVTAQNSITEVIDLSTDGADSDPDGDGNPTNNNTPTPVSLSSPLVDAYIGVAMAVQDTTRQIDGTFTVTYQIVVRNYSRTLLRNVSLTDTLSNVFNPTTGGDYLLVRPPVITSAGSALKLNPNFNGSTDVRIVLGDSTSTLAAGRTDRILVVLNIGTNSNAGMFLNSAYATAKAGIATLSDVSANGLNPDLDGNNNPTGPTEREATPLSLPSTRSDFFIPQGFSPNGDGINDLLVIWGAGRLTVSLEVYNRWGNLVYKNDEYRNDWDGKSNTGITVGQDAGGLPDGAYYYVIRLSDGRRFVRSMTINR